MDEWFVALLRRSSDNGEDPEEIVVIVTPGGSVTDFEVDGFSAVDMAPFKPHRLGEWPTDRPLAP